MPNRGYDWPSDNAAAGNNTEVILTNAGLEDLVRGLSAGSVAELQRVAQGLRAGNAPEKIDRTYLRFPDAQGNGQRAGNSLAIPGHQLTGNARSALVKEWFRGVLCAPRGMAHMAPGLSEPVRRALSEGTDSAGGYAVPIAFLANLIYDEDPLDQVFPFVRKLPVSTHTGWLPAASVNPGMSWGTENVSIDESDPEFGQVPWSVQRMNSFLPLSRELADDSNIVDYVMRLFMQCIRSERDRVIAVGTGSGQPMGLYSASGIYDSGVTSLTYQNLLALKYAVDARYHALPSFRWTFNQKVLAAILAIEDTVQRPIFRQAPVVGAPPTILGTPFSISNHFPDTYIGIGALEYYIWFDRQQVTVEKSLEAGTAFQTHQMWLKFIQRCDGKPALPPTVPMARSTVLAGIS